MKKRPLLVVFSFGASRSDVFVCVITRQKPRGRVVQFFRQEKYA
jgi:hypothetical protein